LLCGLAAYFVAIPTCEKDCPSNRPDSEDHNKARREWRYPAAYEAKPLGLALVNFPLQHDDVE
jgi:hypothetical protein